MLGPIPDSQLGFTLSHEHILTSQGQGTKHYPWMFDWDSARRVAVESLNEMKTFGIDSLIDLTTPDLARDINFIVDVVTATQAQVVVATGMWRDVPRSFAVREIDESADIFVREIEVGIDDSGVKAGVIKVANDENELTPAHERVLRAAARASNRTGCPISTHHWAQGKQGLEQVRIFQEEDVQMDRVCIGHSADTDDLDYLETLLNAGVYLSMDRYPGVPPRLGWEQRNASVKALIDRGWAGRLMLGHDGHATFPFPLNVPPPEGGHRPDGSLLFVSRTAIPALLEQGVSQDDIDLMTKEAPRRFLAGTD
ncbi:MAG: phosphotriesterase-related protein [Dehalococcoidia bacterium]